MCQSGIDVLLLKASLALFGPWAPLGQQQSTDRGCFQGKPTATTQCNTVNDYPKVKKRKTGHHRGLFSKPPCVTLSVRCQTPVSAGIS